MQEHLWKDIIGAMRRSQEWRIHSLLV